MRNKKKEPPSSTENSNDFDSTKQKSEPPMMRIINYYNNNKITVPAQYSKLSWSEMKKLQRKRRLQEQLYWSLLRIAEKKISYSIWQHLLVDGVVILWHRCHHPLAFVHNQLPPTFVLCSHCSRSPSSLSPSVHPFSNHSSHSLIIGATILHY